MSNAQSGQSKARATVGMLHRNISSKTGQPMAAVRFSDMQGKSHWMAISPYFLRTSQKRLPRLPPAGGALSFAFMPKRRAAAGEVLARGGLEGTASPKKAAPPRSFPCGIYLPPGAGGGWGRSRRRRLGGTGLSLRGGFLQGLLLWCKPHTG